jgi:hypothetical protein
MNDAAQPLIGWGTAELNSGESARRMQPDALSNPVQRKRILRQHYIRMPLFVRPSLLFFIAISFNWVFSTEPRVSSSGSCKLFWFCLRVDAKIRKQRHARRLEVNLAPPTLTFHKSLSNLHGAGVIE